MARGRMLSRSLGSSRRFNALERFPNSEFYQLLFTLLVPHVDDFGRMSGDSFTIKLQVFPGSSRSEDEFADALCHLHESQLITLYLKDGDIFLQVNKFADHQQGLANRTASRISPPPKDVCRQLPTNVRDYYSRARAELNLTKEERSLVSKNKLITNACEGKRGLGREETQIGGSRKPHKHHGHAFCPPTSDGFCVPERLHLELQTQLGAHAPNLDLLAWYVATDQKRAQEQPTVTHPFNFWRDELVAEMRTRGWLNGHRPSPQKGAGILTTVAFECPHVEKHFARHECDLATQLGKAIR